MKIMVKLDDVCKELVLNNEQPTVADMKVQLADLFNINPVEYNITCANERMYDEFKLRDGSTVTLEKATRELLNIDQVKHSLYSVAASLDNLLYHSSLYMVDNSDDLINSVKVLLKKLGIEQKLSNKSVDEIKQYCRAMLDKIFDQPDKTEQDECTEEYEYEYE